MSNIKNLVKPIILFVTFFVSYLLIILTLNYTGFLKLSSLVKINFAIVAIIFLVVGIIRGKKTSKKGYLEGLKLGAIAIGVLFLLNLILYRKFDLFILVYYLTILASSTIGSMIGINLKR